FHTIVSIKNDGHYFCRAGGNRPDGLNEPVTVNQQSDSSSTYRVKLMRPPRVESRALYFLETNQEIAMRNFSGKQTYFRRINLNGIRHYGRGGTSPPYL
ncbi:hypothetical protein, partial [Klebsiella pneumoniae]|uniref:hypothetical protein n=1 Tax=Klebsiella pneumoniae TaxID=573 RepID=UPI001D0103B2